MTVFCFFAWRSLRSLRFHNKKLNRKERKESAETAKKPQIPISKSQVSKIKNRNVRMSIGISRGVFYDLWRIPLGNAASAAITHRIPHTRNNSNVCKYLFQIMLILFILSNKSFTQPKQIHQFQILKNKSRWPQKPHDASFRSVRSVSIISLPQIRVHHADGYFQVGIGEIGG